MSVVSASRHERPVHRLALVLGDQLWEGNPALASLDPRCDQVLMIEADSEAGVVWSHKARIALFLSAMRHFAAELRGRAVPLDYVALDDAPADRSFAQRLAAALQRWQPDHLVVTEPGEWRMRVLLQDTCAAAGVPLQVLPDPHFMCSREAFAQWAEGRRELRMEFFYREMRRRTGVLMQNGATGRKAEPEGGQWNYDEDNRQAYPRGGPGWIPEPARFEPDALTREVLALVERRFPGHPGSLASFGWPVTRAQALQALEGFIANRLLGFGAYQDAMWTDTPWGWHSLLSTALNLHLIDPREVIAAAERAWRSPPAGCQAPPLSAVEGFIRQILGWREFIRGVYWLDMPGLRDANHFGHTRPLPQWYWSGETRMACMRDTVGQTLRHGYAHHIQRLMVTGQFALLAGLSPQAVADWYLAMYVDAVEWVELPNTAGMALFAHTLPDGRGRITSKPYVASGQYIRRMSNYCDGCPYRPAERTGPQACPVTTLYWAFLDRHEALLAANPRTVLMAKSIQRLSGPEREAIRQQAGNVLAQIDHL